VCGESVQFSPRERVLCHTNTQRHKDEKERTPFRRSKRLHRKHAKGLEKNKEGIERESNGRGRVQETREREKHDGIVHRLLLQKEGETICMWNTRLVSFFLPPPHLFITLIPPRSLFLEPQLATKPHALRQSLPAKSSWPDRSLGCPKN
jgi:hypothetical protein